MRHVCVNPSALACQTTSDLEGHCNDNSVGCHSEMILRIDRNYPTLACLSTVLPRLQKGHLPDYCHHHWSDTLITDTLIDHTVSEKTDSRRLPTASSLFKAPSGRFSCITNSVRRMAQTTTTKDYCRPANKHWQHQWWEEPRKAEPPFPPGLLMPAWGLAAGRAVKILWAEAGGWQPHPKIIKTFLPKSHLHQAHGLSAAFSLLHMPPPCSAKPWGDRGVKIWINPHYIGIVSWQALPGT